MFASLLSWQEIHSDLDRFSTASQLMEQIDLIGNVTLASMAKDESKTFSNSALLVQLSRTKGDDDN